MQKCLGYIISNALQEWLHKTNILPFFRSDHSPILVSYNKPTQISLRKVF